MQSAGKNVLKNRWTATLSVLIALVLTITSSTHAADGLANDPYPVFVTFDSAYARCGPSHDYYRTDSLRQGQELEVYVETEDGWLGFRPPENSFCWVPASAIKAEKRGTVGTVIEDRTVAWIGTHLGRAKRYRWQVQLAEGEAVTVIGRSEREGPEGPQTWYRIVPPSGEFRWVHRDQVAYSAEELIAAIEQNRQSEPAGRTQNRDRVAAADRDQKAKPSPAESPSRSRLADLGKSILSLAGSEATEPSQLEAVVVQASGPSASSDALANDGRPDSSRRTASTLQRIAAENTIALQAAPQPVHTQTMPQPRSELIPAVGSGLSNQWQTNEVRQGVSDSLGAVSGSGRRQQPAQQTIQPAVQRQIQDRRGEPTLAKADFVSRPRLTEIGIATDAAAPMPNVAANDSNWIIGAARRNVAGNQQAAQSQAAQSQAAQSQANSNAAQNPGLNSVQQVSGLSPYAPQQFAAQQVSTETIAAVELQTRDADVGQLQLLLSRLMASRSSSAEAKPVADAARRIAISTSDDLTAARARLLSERVEQYQRVAERRDATIPASQSMSPVQPASYRGDSIVPSAALPQVAMPQVAMPPANATQSYQGAAVPQGNSQTVPTAAPAVTGYLVQVYSARPNSPPYALTDRSGNTISYVTPAPGVNIRHHINSYITVTGKQGFLQGLNTPNVMANRVTRAIE